MTYLLLILTIFIWPFGQLLTFHLPGSVSNLYLLDISLGLLTLSILLHKSSREKILTDPLFKPLAIFSFIAIATLLINFRNLQEAGFVYPLLYLGRLLIYPSAYFAIKFSKKDVLRPILISFSILCLLGVSQYLFLPDMRFLKLIGFDDHYFRLIGTFYDPNFTGLILAAAALLFISIGNWNISIPLIIMLALTFSRASFLSFAVGLIYLLFMRKRYSLFIFLIGLAIAIWLIPKPFGEGVNLLRTFSIFSRFDSWKTGLDLFLSKPLFGWGYNTLRSLTGDRFQIDNSYLLIAVTTGILGLISFLSLIKKSITDIPLPKQLFLTTILIHSLFNNSFFYIWINFAYWVVLALPLKEYKQA